MAAVETVQRRLVRRDRRPGLSQLCPKSYRAAGEQMTAQLRTCAGQEAEIQAQLRAAGAAVPADDSPLHRLDGRQLCRLAAAAETADRDAVLPHYARAPDATRHTR